MSARTSSYFTPRIEGWAASPEAQSVIFWRIMHLYMARYGSVPIGQMLVELTTEVLNELGRPPTVTDLCEATGLPKSSISRYVSTQMKRGMVQEIIDPGDRRRRKLVLTDKGLEERRWQVKNIRKIIEDTKNWDQELGHTSKKLDPEEEFQRMKQTVSAAPQNIGHKRKKRRAAA